MSIEFSPDRKSYVVSTGLLDRDGRRIVRTKPCPDLWSKFGRPRYWKGEPGYMGPRRTWMVNTEEGEKRMITWMFWPIRVLEGLNL